MSQFNRPLQLHESGLNTIQFKQLHPDAKLPTYATDGSAAFDFYAVQWGSRNDYGPVKVPLGLACEVPRGSALMILARSGHGVNFGAGIPHGVGLIDSDYRGELFMVFAAEKAVDEYFAWCAGDRIAQGLIVPAPQYRLEWADELSETARGAGGFGSSGK